MSPKVDYAPQSCYIAHSYVFPYPSEHPEEKYHLVPTWADAEFEASVATKDDACLLNLPPGKPVLNTRRVTYSANYEVIEVVNSIYRGDRFTFYSGRQLIAG